MGDASSNEYKSRGFRIRTLVVGFAQLLIFALVISAPPNPHGRSVLGGGTCQRASYESYRTVPGRVSTLRR